MKHSPEYVAQWRANLAAAQAIGPVTDAELDAFVAAVTANFAADFIANGYTVDVNRREAVYTRGPKRARIVAQCPLKDEAGRNYHAFAYCFIDLTNGDILKAAGYNAPAKGVRGNIRAGSAANWWNDALTAHGAAYLR